MKTSSVRSLLLALPLALAITAGTGATYEETAEAAPRGANCSGHYKGKWNFKGGRPMALEMKTAADSDRSLVTLIYSELAMPLEGTCVLDEDRGAVVNFDGMDQNGIRHYGAVYIAPGGLVSGAIDGYSFRNSPNSLTSKNN